MVERPVAVVSGANRGIGREVVRQLAERGYETVLGARDALKGEAEARELGVISRQLDVADDSSVERFAHWVGEKLGRCDVLVNNAAIHYDTWQRGVDADLGVVREALETNLLGAWRLSSALIPLLRRAPHGRLVNVSSGAG